MPSNFSDFFRPKIAQRNGLQVVLSSVAIGTGGTNVTASSTISAHIPVGRVKVSVLSLAIEGIIAATGSAAITVQVFAVKAGVATALTAATSLKNDVITAQGNFPLALTSSFYIDGGNATRTIDGTAAANTDYLRVDLVAAGTVTLQPTAQIVAELAVKE